MTGWLRAAELLRQIATINCRCIDREIDQLCVCVSGNFNCGNGVNKKDRVRPQQIELSERARQLLKALVECYVRDGQPVGSKALAVDAGLDVSAATIRNVMADLERLGLVSSPHTSAGRIPTGKGYRFFVDSLLTAKPPHANELERIKSSFDPEGSEGELLDSVTGTLSDLTKMAGVVMVPRRDYLVLRRIEFVSLGAKRVLAVLVISEKEIQNRVLTTARDFSSSELQEAANYLNSLFAGKDLFQVRRVVMEEIQHTKELLSDLMQSAIELMGSVFDSDKDKNKNDAELLLSGQTNLMRFAELSDLDRLRQLFEAFVEKRDILHLLDECLTAQSMQVYIGDESGCQVLDACSIVTAPYEMEGKVIGVLGVIGPTRMPYERIIPLVDVTARWVGSLLKSRN